MVYYVTSPPPAYDLFLFNCTSFVASACVVGGVNLPDYNSYFPIPLDIGGQRPYANVKAPTPAALGVNLRKQSTNVVTGNAAAHGKGPCN